MADFCHDWDPGDIGCVLPMRENGGTCPPDCLGDFTAEARAAAATLECGEEIDLGVCEGHGGHVVLRREHDGFHVRHVPIEGLRHYITEELEEGRMWVQAKAPDPKQS
jgi:hypothetical protein